MLSLPLPVRVYLCLEPTDMRRSFDGLCRMVREHVGADPLSGDLFVFRSKRGDRVKLLYWLGDGLAIWYRRLEEGTFVFPKGIGGGFGTVVVACGGQAGAGDSQHRSGHAAWTAWTWPASSGRNAINDQRRRPPRPQTIRRDGTSNFFKKSALLAHTLSGPWGFILHEHGRNDTSARFSQPASPSATPTATVFDPAKLPDDTTF